MKYSRSAPVSGSSVSSPGPIKYHMKHFDERRAGLDNRRYAPLNVSNAQLCLILTAARVCASDRILTIPQPHLRHAPQDKARHRTYRRSGANQRSSVRSHISVVTSCRGRVATYSFVSSAGLSIFSLRPCSESDPRFLWTLLYVYRKAFPDKHNSSASSYTSMSPNFHLTGPLPDRRPCSNSREAPYQPRQPYHACIPCQACPCRILNVRL